MVEFEFQPWKKIVVHEVIKLPLQNFLANASLGVESGGIGRRLLWTDGFVFELGFIPDTEDIVREKLGGIVHWGSLTYGVLEKFQDEFKVEGNIRIPVIDASNNVIFKEMTSWIRKTFEKK